MYVLLSLSLSLSLSKQTLVPTTAALLPSPMKPPSRKLQQDNDDRWATPSLSVNYSPDPLLQPINGPPSMLNTTRHFKPNSPFDSSVAVTSLVLLSALFFIWIASFYIRRCADTAEASNSRRRRPHPSHSSSSVPPWRSTSARGLHPSTVRSLPLIPYGGEAKHPIDCAICLSEFEVGETVRLIPYCHHVFHPQCVDTWLSSHVSCPLCRCTRILAVEEVRFGVAQAGDDQGVNDSQRRSTAESGAIRVDEEVEPVGMRRACTCSSFGDPVARQTGIES